MYLPRATISAGSTAVVFAEKNLEATVSFMHARIAITTSKMHSFVRQNIWLPRTSSNKMDSPCKIAAINAIASCTQGQGRQTMAAASLTKANGHERGKP